MIARDPAGAAREPWDVLVIGGGVYGIALALEAVRRRLRPLLIERDDFGGATSRNHLRILHGGFRYLQSADLPRFFESVAERRWFLRHFPDLAQPLPCLMPLYGRGVRRAPVLQAGLWANDLLSLGRNRGVRADRHLPSGRIVNPTRVAQLYGGVPPADLRAGAVWYDAFVPDPPRLLMEMLHRACARGAAALNYVEAEGLLRSGSRVAGVRAVDRLSGETLDLCAPLVINAAGPWCRELAERLDRDHPGLFRGTLAWNLLLDREPPSDHALAVTAPRPGAQTLFLVPWKERLLAGTGHAAWTGAAERPALAPAQRAAFLRDLNEAAPAFGFTDRDVLRVYAGLLPGTRDGGAELTERPALVDHGAAGGPSGLWSIAGIKFTTARRLAQRTLERAAPRSEAGAEVEPAPGEASRLRALRFGPSWEPDRAHAHWEQDLRRIVAEESVVHLDDLLVRRTSLADVPSRAEALAPRLCEIFDWDEPRKARELERVKHVLEESR